MKDVIFCNSFSFRSLILKQTHHTDNSMGIPCHFIARMNYGTARFVSLDGETMTVRQGDIFYLPMGLQYHSYWTPDEEPHAIARWESYSFQVFPNPNETHYKMQQLFPSDQAIAYLDRLAQVRSVDATAVGWLYLFLGEVMLDMKEKKPDPNAQLLARAKRYIAEHPDLKVSKLARHCNMSESGLYAFFRRYAQMTPIEMKHQMCVEQATELLRSTDLSIEEISRQLKFSSSAYFRKVVKEQTGKTPSALRKEQSLTDRL